MNYVCPQYMQYGKISDFTSTNAASAATLVGHNAVALLGPQLLQRLRHELLVDPAEVGHVALALLVAIHAAY